MDTRGMVLGMAENVGRRGDSWFFRIDLPPGPDGKRRQRRASGFAQRARGPPGPGADQGGHRRRPAAPRAPADRGGPGGRVVGGGATQPEGVDVQQLRLADAGLRGAPDRACPAGPPFAGGRSEAVLRAARARAAAEGAPLSGTQVRNIHRVLHNALNYAVRLGYIARNPTEAVDKPREDTEERTVYTPEQIRRFLAGGGRRSAPGHVVSGVGDRVAHGRNWPVCDGGMWRWIGSRRRWRCARRGRPPGHEVVEHDPKSRSSRRVLHLDRGTAEVLRRHRAAMAAEAELRGEHALARLCVRRRVR